MFSRSDDPAATAAWYRTHLGLPIEDFGGATLGAPAHEAVWAPFAANTDYFDSTDQPFMAITSAPIATPCAIASAPKA